ncbi:MAG: YfhO family protein [Bacteroidales bacterium]|nr:YfhO family protein [Bacteroidales bacterium]MCF8402914.1 YfhO family protein [Bacteroidales bacterium]
MKNIQFKKLLPFVVAVLIFLGLTMAYFSPLFEGKVLRQDDIIRHKGMAKEIVDFREATGQEALWTNSMFSGMPAYQISVQYKKNLVQYIDSLLRLGLPRPADMVFLYMIGFFILLVALGVNPWLSIAGAIIYGFSSYFFIILEAGHNSKAHAIGYMAPALAGIILTYRGKYLLGGVITLLFMALQIRAGHPQMTYYLMMLVLVLGILELYEAVKSKHYLHFSKATGILFVAVLIALLTNITNLWATWEYGKYTIRGKSELTSEKENRTSGLDKDYATQWSYGIAETGTLLIPNFHGGASQAKLSESSHVYDALIQNNIPPKQAKEYIKAMPTYWGTQPFTSGPVYVGAIVVFMFVFGLFAIKGRFKWWLLLATLLSIMLAWGKNFPLLTNLFLDYFPGYNKFRAVSMTLVIAEVAMPILAFVALNEIFKSSIDKKSILKNLTYALYIVGGFCLIFALLPGIFFDFTSPNDIQYKQGYPEWLLDAIILDRGKLMRLDALRSLSFILITAGGIWAYVSGKLKKSYLLALIILIAVIDMWPVDRRYVDESDFIKKSSMEKPFTKSLADEFILKDTDPNYRVLNVMSDPFKDAQTSYFHKSIGGYHGAKLRRYQELYDHHVGAGFNMEILNMLNTKYFIQPGKDKKPVAVPNMEALGNAWFVNDYLLVDNADEELEKVGEIKPADVAVIDKRFKSFIENYTPGRDSTGQIKLIEYAPNKLVYQSNTTKDQLTVFSEIYYEKGWNAYVDGELIPHFRVDYVLRGMILPAGKHMVEFKFEPKVYYVGEKISLASSLLLILMVLGYVAFEVRNFLKKS